MSIVESGGVELSVDMGVPLVVRVDFLPQDFRGSGIIYHDEKIDFQSTPPKPRPPPFPSSPRPTTDPVRQPNGKKKPPIKKPGQAPLPWS